MLTLVCCSSGRTEMNWLTVQGIIVRTIVREKADGHSHPSHSFASSTAPGSPQAKWLDAASEASFSSGYMVLEFLLLRVGLASIHIPWCKVCIPYDMLGSFLRKMLESAWDLNWDVPAQLRFTDILVSCFPPHSALSEQGLLVCYFI